MRASFGSRVSTVIIAATLLISALTPVTVSAQGETAKQTYERLKREAIAAINALVALNLQEPCLELKAKLAAAQRALADARQAAASAKKQAAKARKAADDAKKRSDAEGQPSSVKSLLQDQSPAEAEDAADAAAKAADKAQDDAANDPANEDAKANAKTKEDEASSAASKADRLLDPTGGENSLYGNKRSRRAARDAERAARAAARAQAAAEAAQAAAAAAVEALDALIAQEEPCGKYDALVAAADAAIAAFEKLVAERSASSKTNDGKDLVKGWKERVHPRPPAGPAPGEQKSGKKIELPTPGIVITPGSGDVQTKTADGLQTGTFKVPAGSITVVLPDDIRVGDTISGTVSVEPAGQTPEEQAANRRKLSEYVIVVPFAPAPIDPNAAAPPNILKVGSISGIVLDPVGPRDKTIGGFYVQDPEPDQGPNTSEGVFVFTKPDTPGVPSGVSVGPTPTPTPKPKFVVNPNGIPPVPSNLDLKLYRLPNQDPPVGAGTCGRSGGMVAINESCSPISQLVFTAPLPKLVTQDIVPSGPTTKPGGSILPPTPPTPTGFETPMGYPPGISIPPLGQTGRPVVINGPFDGNSTNTGVTCQPVGPTTATLPAKSCTPIYVLAENPRRAVVSNPSTITGPAQITVKEGGATATGAFRNLKIDLTAPKTSLLKGESTELRVTVNGLEGLEAPVPLTLQCTGVINMQGGPYQPLMIQPSQVGPGGVYTTTRNITGLQTGAWGATGTVVTGRFNAALQDDSKATTVILWNTVTGEYRFTGPFPRVQPSGQPPPTALTGTGKMVMKGCILTLTHNAPDRRVFATLDACTNSGNATVETTTPKAKVTITDTNTADNTVGQP